MSKPWLGVDFDGTLAHYDGWKGDLELGEPISEMADRVKKFIQDYPECDVRIFTARVFPLGVVSHLTSDHYVLDPEHFKDYETYEANSTAIKTAIAIMQWCERHLGKRLTVTCVKDYDMVELWDDRAVGVHANTGKLKSESTRFQLD